MPVSARFHPDLRAMIGRLPPGDDVRRRRCHILSASGTDIDLALRIAGDILHRPRPVGQISASAQPIDGVGELTWGLLPFVFATRGGRSWHLPILSRRVKRVRLVIAECSVDYAGRLTAHLPMATRLIMLKADGSILIHSDGGSYKPLNWMTPPCSITVTDPSQEQTAAGLTEIWTVSQTKTGDKLVISIAEVIADDQHEFGIDPGLVKDGVEAHLQELLAEHIETLGDGYSLVRREYMTAIGPVDILARDHGHTSVAVEIKRRGDIDGVEQLTRYLELMNRDPLLTPVRGVFAAQEIKPQARTLAEDRGIRCVVLDYDALRGMDDPDSRLF